MTRTRILISAAVAASALALTACADSGDDPAAAPTSSAGAGAESGTSAESGAPAESDSDAPAEAGEPTAADVMFSRMMIPHHEQAIEMSDIILAKPDIPADVTALAEKIKAEQGPEIEQMEAWLDEWDQPTGPRDGHGGHGGGSQGDGGMNMGEDMSMMGGMLSADELQQLSDAEGTDAVRRFLEQMIAHHEGAIDMARGEVADGGYQPTIDLARSIIDTQQREIATMRDMLSAM